MSNKTTWITIVSVLLTGVFANLDRIMDYFEAVGIGVSVSQLSQAKAQVAIWERHVGKRPVDIITVELPKGRIVQCQPYSDGDTLVVSQTADGESKSVWVPLERFDGTSWTASAYAASRQPYIRRVCATRSIFHKGIQRNVIMQILVLSNGQCVARLIDPARKGAVLSQVATRCPRGCG